MSEEDSTSDTTTEDTEESEPTETLQVNNALNETTHDENDTSDENSVIEIELPNKNREQKIGKEDKLVTTSFQVEMEN